MITKIIKFGDDYMSVRIYYCLYIKLYSLYIKLYNYIYNKEYHHKPRTKIDQYNNTPNYMIGHKISDLAVFYWNVTNTSKIF